MLHGAASAEPRVGGQGRKNGPVPALLAELPPGLRVGHPLIDRQHAVLFRLIDAISEGPEEVLCERLRDLAKYAVEHFRCEEDLMRQAGWNCSERHCAGHAGFTDRLGEEMRIAGAGRRRREAITRWLGGWLADHIGVEDVLLARALAGKPDTST